MFPRVLNVAIPAKSDYMTIFADLEKYKPANIALSPNIGLTSGIQNLKAGVGLRVTMKVKIESGDKT